MRKYLCFFSIVCSFTLLFGQDIWLESDFKGSFVELTQKIESENEVNFLYKSEWIDDITINYVASNDLTAYLIAATQKNGLSIVFREQFIIVIPSNPILYLNAEELEENYGEGVKIIGEKSGDDSPIQVKIKVVDGSDESAIIGVRVFSQELADGGITDQLGEIAFQIVPGLYTFNLSHLGFEESSSTVLIKGSGTIVIDLFESSVLLDEVSVSAQSAADNIQSAQMGVTTITPDLVKKLPSLYGEADVLKTLTLLPGVSTAGEGTQGFTVRGGKTDQNLLLFDGTTIYNASHLFGFFSNINSEVIGSATLFKSSIPARYGGRSSSVLTVDSKEPSFDQVKMNLGVGLVSSKIFVEMPLIKGKTSMLLAGRKSYTDWILNRQKNISIQRSSGKFNDLNIKILHKLGENDKLSVSGYSSFDEFQLASDTSFGWTTQTASLTWDHIFSKRLSMQAVGSISDYKFKIKGLTDPFQYTLTSGISNKTVTAQLFYDHSASLKIEGGAEYKSLVLKQGEFSLPENSQVNAVDLQREYADIVSFFGQGEMKVNTRITIETGLRLSSYRYLGPRVADDYLPGLLRTNETISGQTIYDSDEKIKSYFNFEPRFSLRFSLDQNSSLKMSYNRNYQYLHSLSNTSSITPIEVWKASDQFLAPLRNDQYSFGYFRNLLGDKYETSIEFYYRDLTNVVDYRNAARILLNPNMEQAVISGDGVGYGTELYIKKNSGRLNGWLSYSFSRTKKKIAGNFAEETVNSGQFYPAEFDRPHNLSMVATYQINRRLYLGANFLFSSGLPFTGPEVRFLSNGTFLTYFSERNQYRTPAYHRLDLSVRIDESLKKNKRLRGSWVFSLYNFYARRNAYSVFIGERRTSSPVALKLSVLGRIFPSLTYNLRIE